MKFTGQSKVLCASSVNVRMVAFTNSASRTIWHKGGDYSHRLCDIPEQRSQIVLETMVTFCMGSRQVMEVQTL